MQKSETVLSVRNGKMKENCLFLKHFRTEHVKNVTEDTLFAWCGSFFA